MMDKPGEKPVQISTGVAFMMAIVGWLMACFGLVFIFLALVDGPWWGALIAALVMVTGLVVGVAGAKELV